MSSMLLTFIGAAVYCWKQQYLQLVVSACYIQGTGSGASSGHGEETSEGLSWSAQDVHHRPSGNLSSGMG